MTTSSQSTDLAATPHAEIQRRMGLVPNFFRTAAVSPEVTTNLWEYAKLASLDSPLPPLLKERLFVYLSRFCTVRYCLARHVGFLLGLGNVAGDPDCLPQSYEDAVRLLKTPVLGGEELETLSKEIRLHSPIDLAGVEPDTPRERALFSCASHVFRQSSDAVQGLNELRGMLGGPDVEHLLTFTTYALQFRAKAT